MQISISINEAITLSSILDRELGSIAKALEECLDGKTPATEQALRYRQKDTFSIARMLRLSAEMHGVKLCEFTNLPKE